jgi:hypothetical protein
MTSLSLGCNQHLKMKIKSIVVRSGSSDNFFVAICAVGCVNGECNNPGECYCNAGYSGPLCNVANNADLSQTRGVRACVYSNVTSSCKVANGTLRNDCPVGYSVLDTVACNDVPGFVTNVCGRVCCDGWSGDDCFQRLLAVT